MMAEWGRQDFIQNCGNWVKFSGDEVEEEWALEQEGEGSDGGHTGFWGASPGPKWRHLKSIMDKKYYAS